MCSICAAQPSSWVQRDSGTGAGLLAATYGPFNGQPIFLLGGEGRTIATSIDGAHWSSSSPGGTTYFDAASNGTGGFMLAGGDGVIAGIGVNGVDYTQNILFTGVAYGNGIWSAVGGYFAPGPILEWFDIYTRTPNGGNSWDAAIADLSGRLMTPYDVAFGGGFGGNKFIAAMGTGKLRMSTDGIHFNDVDDTGLGLQGIAFGNDIWVCVGNAGRICRSIDGGFNWQCAGVAGNKTLSGVTYGGGYFVAVGQDSLILYSADGQSWAAANSPSFPGRFLDAVTYGDGTWIATGEQGLVLQSSIKPDLREFVPPGWSGAIVTGPVPGSNQSAPIRPGDSVYVDFALTNAGKTTASASVLYLLADGDFLTGFNVPALTPNGVAGVPDLRITGFSPGEHTIEVQLDVGSVVNEFDEGNNVFSRTFVIESECLGDLNGDRLVDDGDFSIFALAYNLFDCADPTMPLQCPSDLNKDSVVDDADFVIFIAGYNTLLCDAATSKDATPAFKAQLSLQAGQDSPSSFICVEIIP